MITLYGLPNCDRCRAARAWLRQRGLDHEFVDLRATPPAEAQLRRWQAAAGWEALLNRRSTTWRGLPAAERAVSAAGAARQLIRRHPAVMKRPLLDCEAGILVGFAADAYARLLGPGDRP